MSDNAGVIVPTEPPYPRHTATVAQLYAALALLHAWARHVEPQLEEKPAEPVGEMPEIELLRSVSIGTLWSALESTREIRRRYDAARRELSDPREWVKGRKELYDMSAQLLQRAFMPPGELQSSLRQEVTSKQRDLFTRLQEFMGGAMGGDFPAPESDND